MKPSKIGTVTVSGSESGQHTGKFKSDSDGEGASFFPDKPFTPGETVSVKTSLDITGESDGDFSFSVVKFADQEFTPRKSDKAPADEVQHFKSEPSLQPPTYTVQTGSLDAAGGDVLLAPRSGPGQYGPMIVDPDGHLVWFNPVKVGQEVWDFNVQQYQGKPVLTWWQGDAIVGHGRGVGEIYDENYQKVATVKAGNGYSIDSHDFVITSANTALVTIYQPIYWDLTPVDGPSDGIVYDSIAQEIDIATGNVLAEWHALDHVKLTDSYYGKAKKDKPYDFFHINSVELGSDGNWLISARAVHAIYHVNIATGDILWQLGGKNSDFTGDGTDFSSQHDARWVGENKISIFNNAQGVGKPTSPHSAGKIIALDLDKHTATLEKEYSTPTVPRAQSQGDTQVLDDGSVFIGWGSEHYASQFDKDGNLTWQVTLPDDNLSYRWFRSPWTGTPTTKPAVAATVDDDDTTGVAVSWNGATEVSSWQVFGADSADDLATDKLADAKPLASASRHGFETDIFVTDQSPKYVVVQALDKDGKVLSTSEPTAVEDETDE